MSRLSRLCGVVFGLISASIAQGQTSSGIVSLTKKEDIASNLAPSAVNPWIAGAQIGYKFVGEGDFADNVFAAGTIIYNVRLDVDPDKWGIPVFSNLASLAADAAGKTSKDSLEHAANALLNTAQGILVKIAPYRKFDRKNIRFTVMTELGGKINSLAARDTTEGKVTFLQGRLAAGLELEIGLKADDEGNRPITVSASAVKSFFSATSYDKVFGERKSDLSILELTGIVPIQKGTGVIVEAGLAKNLAPAIRIGLLVAKSEK